MEKSESLKEAQYWFREVEAIVQFTREEAARGDFTMPVNFAHDERWWKTEAEIDKAISARDYIKTRDLSRAYVVRAVKYCRGWLESKKVKGAAAQCK